MNQDKEVSAPKIGTRLKHARLLMGLNLKELAQKAELTEGYLSKIERDVAQPSFAVLHRLVRVLGLNMSALFPPEGADSRFVSVVRQHDRASITTGHRRAGNQVTLQKLVAGAVHQLLQVNIHVVEPKGGSNELIHHKGEEFGYVLEGELELIVEDTTVRLGAGDAFHFDSEHGHRYQNPGDVTARILWVNTPPTF